MEKAAVAKAAAREGVGKGDEVVRVEAGTGAGGEGGGGDGGGGVGGGEVVGMVAEVQGQVGDM